MRIETEAVRQSFGVYLLLSDVFGPGGGPQVHDPLNEANTVSKALGDAPEWWMPFERHSGDDPSAPILGYVYYPTALVVQRFPQVADRRKSQRRKS